MKIPYNIRSLIRYPPHRQYRGGCSRGGAVTYAHTNVPFTGVTSVPSKLLSSSSFVSLRIHNFSTTTTATPSPVSSPPPVPVIEPTDEYDYSLITPQHPLPIITPPPHVIVPPSSSTAESLSAAAASSSSSSNNSNSNNQTTNTTPRGAATPTNTTFTQHVQHWFKKNLSIPYQQNIIIQGETLFQSAMQQSNLPEWYGPGRIGRDFRSRHAVLTFHVWLLHKRLLLRENPLLQMGQPPPQVHENSKIIPGSNRKDYNMCKDIDVELFNIFWDNTTCRIRALNVYELSVNKHLQNVQKYTFIHLVQYDHCYTEEMLRNSTERMNYLRRLVAIQWLRPKYIDQRNKAYDQGIRFEENSLHHPEDIEDLYRNTAHHIDRIVHYIDTQYQNIVYDLPYDHFTNGHLQYVPLPQFANLHNVGSLTTDDITNTDRTRMMTNVPFLEYADTPVPCHPDDILPHPWITNITNSGKTYYWNPVTRVSSWIRPSPVVTN